MLMILNQSHSTIESTPAGQTQTTSHSEATLPATWQAPLPEQAEAIPQPGNAPTTSRSEVLRKTKIIATLSPATDRSDVLRSLVEAGVSVFRINLACTTRESAMKAVFGIRTLSAELQRPVSLLLETQAAPTAASPAVSENDWADIRFGLECGVDWLAISAGPEGDAVRQVRQFLVEQKRGNVGILARLQGPAPLAKLNQVIQDADGILLDSGNLVDERPDGKASSTWQLIWQQVVQKCVSARKLAVISMAADVDMAAVLFSKPDALLLANETSGGSSPLQSVRKLDSLIRQVESGEGREVATTVTLTTEHDQTVAAAVQQAGEMPAEAIMVLTRTGNSADLCAALRPRQSRVFVFTPDARLARSLRLRYALETFVLSLSEKPNTNRLAAEKILHERKFLAPGAKVVCVTDALDSLAGTAGLGK
jgi:pyruvate kinase